MVALVIVLYLGVVLLVGLLGHRLFRGTSEDYFVASRSIGPFVLLMTLFGTHMTAFSLLGASDEAYRGGISVFALMGSATAIQFPFVVYAIGTRVWWIGKRNGYLTQVQFIRDRYQSDWLGMLLFVVLVLLLLPYVLIGVKGGGDALFAITGGPGVGAPPWVGSLLMCAIVFVYVTYGGMRSTAWVNTFQTCVFMTVGAVAFFVIVGQHGGFGAVMAQLERSHPEFLAMPTGSESILRSLSFLLLPASAGMFPHIFSHWLSARSAGTFRYPMVAYPLCVAFVWVPSVVLGMTGRLDFPTQPAGAVLPALILDNTVGILAGLLGAGVLAAIMSSLDSQTLAAGTMFTQDVVLHYGFHDHLSERGQVLSGRLFVAGLLAVAFFLAGVTERSIFALGVWSLSGFASLIPILLAALYWKRSTKLGVAASILTTAGLWVYFYWDSHAATGPYSVGGTGLLPVGVIAPAAVLALVLVSLVTKPPRKDVLDRFFPASREPVDAGSPHYGQQ